MSRKITVTRGSGNVFADLGFDNPEEEQRKAQLAREMRGGSEKESTPAEDDDVFPVGYRLAQQEQARQLQDQAAKAGLKFEAYLSSRDAIPVLEAVARGDFLTPSELVWVAVQQFLEMQAYPDLRAELLRRELQKRIDDPRPGIPVEEVFARLKVRMEERKRHEPARWEKVGQEFLPDKPREQ